MRHAAAAAEEEQIAFLSSFPKGTMPIDESIRKKSSEADPHIKGFETENRNWLVHYFDSYKNSEDMDDDKLKNTSLSINVKRERETPIFLLPHKEWRNSHFITIRKWEGVVEDVSIDSFVARLKDVAGELPDERVELDFDELTNMDEKSLVEKGAIFSWTMGYSISKSGTRKRQAILIFRRMPKWKQEDIERGFRVADIMYEALGE